MEMQEKPTQPQESPVGSPVSNELPAPEAAAAEVTETTESAEVAQPADLPVVEETPAEPAPAVEPELPAAEELDLPAAEEAASPAEESEESSPEEPAEEAAEERTRRAPLSKDEAVAALIALAEKPAEEITREEVAYIKQQFYAARHAELEAERALYIERGNDPAAFLPAVDPTEERFKELFNMIKEKKAELAAAQEAEKQRNFERKTALIEELATISDDTDNVNRAFPRVKEIQQEFRTIGDVPPTLATDLWKRYQAAIERFYDQLKVNKDLRDYDFKKNLDTKTLLCEQAEALAAEDDIVTAFKRMQDLHDKWRATGPVAKEVRDDIWNRFRDASAVVYKKYQAYFEERKAREQENEAAKTAICERVEALDFDAIKTYAGWDEMTKVILAAQEEWKKLGYASKKNNNLLFARFRAVCDKFFALKADHFKSMKDELASNLQKKIALCEKAEALSESTDWKKTADALVALQKEWKTIGAVAKKQSDAVWQRFQTACDRFFEQRKKNLSDTRSEEQANLKSKRAIVAELKAIEPDTPREIAITHVKDLQARWQEIGHVPFREKDKLYEEYRAAANAVFDRFNVREGRNSVARFESSISDLAGDDPKLSRERERLMRVIEAKRNELKTCENNLGFFNSKSKSGDLMLRELERNIQRIKDDIADIEKKVTLIDEKSKA